VTTCVSAGIEADLGWKIDLGTAFWFHLEVLPKFHSCQHYSHDLRIVRIAPSEKELKKYQPNPENQSSESCKSHESRFGLVSVK
jgi:hypothetical protein